MKDSYDVVSDYALKVGMSPYADFLIEHIQALQSSLEELNQKVAALQQENASLKQDAVRYRWLSNEASNKSPKISVGIWGVNGNSHCGRIGSSPEDVDSAIDTAMQASRQ